MSDNSLGTPEQLRDPNYTPPLGQAIPLGIQHVLAMFVSNVTPAIIIAGVAGFGFGSPNVGNLIYMIQMAILFAGVATLIQTIGMGPVGAKLPIVQGTSFAFLPVMIPAVAGAGVAGMAGLMTGVVIGGIFHMILGLFIGRIRFALPPLVTGLIVLMIGLALVKVGIEYAAGGAGDFNRSQADWGSAKNWFVAAVVVVVTLAVKFMSRGFMSVAAVLIGLIAGYIVAAMFGMVSLAGVGRAGWFDIPEPFKFGFELNWAIIIGMCLMALISAIETVGDVSGITKGGAGREATDGEITGATYADGLGTAIAGVFGSLPNTSFSQNVGLISMTGIMSRGIVTIGAIFLIICGLVPKIGAIIASIPLEVLGGGVIIMFGMVAAAGVNMLSDVSWNRRNMLIFATALSIGLGLQLVPDAMKFLSPTWKILLTSGLLPAAFIAIVLNLLLPEDEDEGSSTALAGLAGSEDRSHGGAGEQAGAGARAVSGMAERAAEHAGQPTSASKLVTGGAALAAGGAAVAAASAKSAASSASSATSSTANNAVGLVSGGASAAKTKASGTAAKAKGTASKAKSSTTAKAKSATGAAKSTAKKAATKAKPKAAASKASASKSSSAKASSAKSSSAKAAPKKAAAKSAPKKASSAKGKLAGSALDDLEFVDGIGPKTSKSLQQAGVKNLSGLIKMSDANLEKAAQKAGTGGRPESEKWKKQATDILGGKPPQAKSDRAAWERAKKKL